MAYSQLSIYGPSIALGLITHQVYRIKEPKMISLSGLLLTVFVIPSLSSLLRLYFPPSSHSSQNISKRFQLPLPTDFIIFPATLFLSILIYRLSPFHPLSELPGPIYLRCSKLIGTFIYATSGHQHEFFRRLHDKYGPVVRIGPNEISVCDVEAVREILGTEGLPKGNYYHSGKDPHSSTSPLLILSGEQHAQRRRSWDHGMSSEALDSYAESIEKRAKQFVGEIEKMMATESSKVEVDISKWISYFSFDFMGDMAFGEGFDMLANHGDKRGYWKTIEDFMYMNAITSHIPWVSELIYTLPFIARTQIRLRKFAAQIATERTQKGAKMKDLWYYLTDEADLEVKKPTIEEVVSDGGLAIIAGSDTVATALTSLVYLLLTHPDDLRRVVEEVDTVYPPGSDALDRSGHGKLVFLDACFKEAMRLYPPLPTNGSRRVPKGSKGKFIAGKFIPEGTEVFLPAYCLHRKSECFSSPDKFIPARWALSSSSSTFATTGATANQEAYIPFSRGPANCAGRNLARQEMLMLAILLFQTFEFEIAKEEDFEVGTWDRGYQDYFASTRGNLRVSLRKRV